MSVPPPTGASLPATTTRSLEQTRAFYDRAPTELRWGARQYRSLLAEYYNRLIPPNASLLEIGCGAGGLLTLLRAKRKAGIDLSARQIEAARAQVPDARLEVQSGELADLEGERFDVIVISDTLNLAADVQQLLTRLHALSHEDTRLVINFQNSLWRPVLTLARWTRLKAAQPENSWLASSDVRNLLRLAGWELVQRQGRILVPVRIPLVATLVNRWLAPALQWFCLTVFMVARPTRAPRANRTVSVVIPARNEAGNIANAVRRTPDLGAGTELIFVEGHSRDETWAEIERVQRDHPERRIRALRQTGIGKGDAVRAGFAAATGDVLMILDADLTMPPEELTKFYDVIASGRADFANGARLVYPMDGQAMFFLNLCANKAFGLIFSWLLGQPVKDTLCGTKALARAHYDQIAANRAVFGEFDPFGDFDLLFGAARLDLRIADVPIRYASRTYGSTNIHRWRHGWLLLRMVVFGARKLKFV